MRWEGPLFWTCRSHHAASRTQTAYTRAIVSVPQRHRKRTDAVDLSRRRSVCSTGGSHDLGQKQRFLLDNVASRKQSESPDA